MIRMGIESKGFFTFDTLNTMNIYELFNHSGYLSDIIRTNKK